MMSVDQATDMLAETPHPYNGEGAFYYKGKTYFVEGALSEENVIHEFSHPFIDAIEKENPTLFENLFKDAVKENPELWDKVQTGYGDFDELGQKKEFLVRMLTSETLNKEKGKEGFLRKLLFALRQLFRKVFGREINISKLDGNTSMKELSQILVQADKINLGTESISQKEEAQFKRDIEEVVKQLNVVDNGDIVTIAENFRKIVLDQLNQKNKSKPGYQDIQENVLTPGQVNRLVNAATHLKSVLNENNTKQVVDLALSLNAIKDWSGRLYERVGEIQEDKNIENRQKTLILSHYVDILESWDNFIDGLNKFIESNKIDVGSEFKSIVNEIHGQVKMGQERILNSDKETLIDVFTDILSGVTNNAAEEFKKAEERYKKNPEAKGAKAAYERAKDKLKSATFDRKEILRFLHGEAGDSSKISGLFNSSASNGDPIVGGFGTFVRQIGYKVLGKVRDQVDDMNTELSKYMHLWDKANPAKSAQKFVTTDERISWDAEGKEIKTEVYQFKNKYKGYKKALAEADHKIQEAAKTSDSLLLKAARDEKNELLLKYFHREYTDKYYEVLSLRNDELGKVAFAKRDELYEDIRREESSFDPDSATEDEKEEHLEIVKQIRRQINQLSSMYDEEGNLKTDPQEIAITERLKEYAEKTRELYTQEEKKGLFESRYNKQKETLLAQGISEDSKEFKDGMQNWLNKNTRTKIKDSFYKRKQELLEILKGHLSKLPDAKQKQLAFDKE